MRLFERQSLGKERRRQGEGESSYTCWLTPQMATLASAKSGAESQELHPGLLRSWGHPLLDSQAISREMGQLHFQDDAEVQGFTHYITTQTPG